MSRVWVISDIHLGHANIVNFRPEFSSAEEHDETILSNIEKTVSKRDALWILGDCFFTTESYETFFSRVFCHKVHWIIGNHDTDTGQRQDNVKRFCKEPHPMYGKIGSLFKYKGLWLSHHPLHPIELRGKKNVHGHTHKELMRHEDGTLDSRYINVCCEHTNYSPVLIGDIIDKTPG
jgi:calcineurin-like phosphoesterase family protein